MPVCFEIWALTDIDKAQVGCIWCVRQYLTSQCYFDLVNPVWFPEVFSISSPFLKRKKAHTHFHLIFTEFYFIMLQTMTSRYIDTQLLLCVYVHLWVYVCVKRAVRPQKQNENPVWGSPQWVNKAEIASERALGDSLCRHTHTHTQTS